MKCTTRTSVQHDNKFRNQEYGRSSTISVISMIGNKSNLEKWKQLYIKSFSPHYRERLLPAHRLNNIIVHFSSFCSLMSSFFWGSLQCLAAVNCHNTTVFLLSFSLKLKMARRSIFFSNELHVLVPRGESFLACFHEGGTNFLNLATDSVFFRLLSIVSRS